MTIELKTLSLKLAAAIILVVGSNAFGQGPSCSAVFFALQSREASIIADLARLKFNSEIAKAQGSRGGFDFAKQMNAAYSSKFQELLKVSDGKYTEASLKEEIREQIALLQGLREEAQSPEISKQQHRKAVRDNSKKLPIYDLAEHVDLNFDSMHIEKFMGYVPEANTLFWLKEIKNPVPGLTPFYQLMKYDLQHRVELEIATDIANMTLFKDQKRALIIFKNGQMQIWSLVTMKVLHAVDLAIKNMAIARLDISPNEELVAVGEGWNFSIFNIKTGAFLLMAGKKPTFSASLKGVRFVNDKEVIFNQGGNLLKMNIDSKLDETLVVSSMVSIHGVEVSADLKNIVMLDLQQATVISSADLKKVDQKMLFPEQGGSRSRRLMAIPGDNSHFVHLAGDYSKRFGIYSKDNFEAPVFSFEDYNLDKQAGNDITGVAFSPDKGTLIITGRKAHQPFLDIWNLKDQ